MGGCFHKLSIEEEFSSFYKFYDCKTALGKGTFGRVFQCEDKVTKETFAVKVQAASKSGQANLKYEIQLWSQISNHPNVVWLLGAHQEANIYFMVMDHCEQSLYERLVQSPKWTFVELVEDLKQILSGLQHLHSSRIIHRDVKAENILYGGAHGRVLKIADFGFALYLKKDEKLTAVLGSVIYMAPEMLLMHSYDLLADMWSIGVLCFLITVGRFPCGETSFSKHQMKETLLKEGDAPTLLATLIRKVSKNLELAEQPDMSNSFTQPILPTPANDASHRLRLLTKKLELYSCIQSFLQTDPLNRCSAKDALKSSLFQTRHSEDDDTLLVVNHQSLFKKRVTKVKHQQAPAKVGERTEESNPDAMGRMHRRSDAAEEEARRKSSVVNDAVDQLGVPGVLVAQQIGASEPDLDVSSRSHQTPDTGSPASSRRLSGFLSDSPKPFHGIGVPHASMSGHSSVASVQSNSRNANAAGIAEPDLLT